ncbi:hypothetical protein JCM10450v2_000364 [Rhodotorula kratochvilovae]
MSSPTSTLSGGNEATHAEAQAQKTAAPGEEGQAGPALRDIEKQQSRSGDEAGVVKGETAAQDKAEEPERDADGVALEDGVPIVRLSGPDDPMSPLNRPKWQRWLIVLVVTSASFCVTCCSSMIAFTYPGVEAEFHVGQEVATLGLSLFVMGMGLFPLLVGPLSEWYGRSPVYFVGFALYVVLNFMVAFANNIVCLLIGRFLAGAAGPVVGPIISGFINQHLDWRWTWYILIMWAGAEFIALVVFVPETYLPAVLQKKAVKLRKAGRTDVRAPIEVDTRSISRVILMSCSRPFEILATEPMALALCTWTAILLGILYMFFSAFGIVYRSYGFSTQIVGLTYIPLGLGIVAGSLCHPIWAGFYRRKTEELGRRPPPEEHLRKGLYGVVICPIALFWFAFTTYSSVHWIVSMIATVPFGVGLVWSFQAVFVYLVDAYRPVAASAMAANSAMRSSFAAAFPLFTTQMFHTLGTQYALMLTAFLCLAMVPFPFLFFKMGHKYRRGSKFANAE